MVDPLNEVLSRNNLKYEDLTVHEREYLQKWLEAIKTNTLSIPRIKEYIAGMRAQVEQELTDKNDVPTTWLGIMSFLIPIIGMIRKWYADQRQLELKARLRSYVMLEAMVTSPEKAQEAVDRAIASFASSVNKK